MTDPDDVLAQLEALKADYERLDAEREQVKERIVEAAIEAFKQDKEPADIYERTPFSHVWIRAQVREAGIPKAKPGTKPRPRKRATPPTPRATGATMPKPKQD